MKNCLKNRGGSWLFLLCLLMGLFAAILWISGIPSQEPVIDEAAVDGEEEEPSVEEELSVEEEITITLEDQAREKLSQMSLEEKVAQMFVVTPESITGVSTVIQAGNTTRQAIATYPVGGIIYMAANLVDPEQTREMLANTMAYSQEAVGLPLFLAVDEEGGTVARVASNASFGVTNVGNMCDIGATGDTTVAYEAGVTMGTYLSDLGFTVDFAPVADVLTNSENTVVKKRSFGTDAELVCSMVAAEVTGLEECGVLACIKHFPGHGASGGDTHDGAVVVSKTIEELWEAELIPFAEEIEAGISMIMVGHFSLPKVTGDYTPCSLSESIVTGLLREEMGYDGIVITDALNMSAITTSYTSAEAAICAVEAGVDMLLMPEDFVSAYNGLLEAVEEGRISEERIDESVMRILRVKLQM